MPRSSKSFLFPDVNVWAALTSDEHIHYRIAARWFASLDEASRLAFCRFTQLSFLRLLTTLAVMGAEVMTQIEAWQVYNQWLDDPRVVFLDEPASLDQALRLYAKQKRPLPRIGPIATCLRLLNYPV